MKRSILVPAVMLALSACVGGATYAATDSAENDPLAVMSAKIDLRGAVAAAEQRVGGKASKAEYERHNGEWVYDVEVVKDRKVMDVKVDGMTGSVIAATEDKADKDDDA